MQTPLLGVIEVFLSRINDRDDYIANPAVVSSAQFFLPFLPQRLSARGCGLPFLTRGFFQRGHNLVRRDPIRVDVDELVLDLVRVMQHRRDGAADGGNESVADETLTSVVYRGGTGIDIVTKKFLF